MIVAIDGPAGSGKSTVAREVAKATGFFYLNSGKVYRAITYSFITAGVEVNDHTISQLLPTVAIELSAEGVKLNGCFIDPVIHTDAVDKRVADVSSYPQIREFVNKILINQSRGRNVVVEGRDMTTVVFPKAEVKWFIDATAEARARRRFGQGTSKLNFEEILVAIQQRDTIDKQKKVGALMLAADATYLDTSDLTIEAVCAKVTESIQGHKSSQEYYRNMADKEQQVSPENTLSKQEMLQEEYLKSLDELEDGQLVDGFVAQVTDEHVYIDVGYKSEGKISVSEFSEVPKIGETVSVVLVSKEGRHGEILVSKRKADERVVWKQIKEAFENKGAAVGKVVRTVKGGFEVDLGGGTRGFNPISKMDLFRIEDPERYVGLESSFYIERLFSEKRVNIILSRRAWLEEEVEKMRTEFFASVHEGDVVKGIVKSFTSFGAFVDLGGFDGLLHINDMSWGHVARPKDVVKKGEELELKVVRLDHENQKINLSLKEMTRNPWDTFHEQFELNQVVEGVVTKLTDFGAFIEIEEGIEGLAHISELSWTKRINHPKDVLNIGDKVQAKILGFDLDAHKVSLGVKQVTDNPWETIDAKYPVGMRLTKVVKKITASGAFVELEDGIDGFLHADELSWTKKIKNPGTLLTEGEEIEVIVISSDPESRNVRLGVKQLSEDPWGSLKKAFPEGSVIEGEITNITTFGIFVRVQGDIEGLVNKSQVVDPRLENVDEALNKYKVGDKVKVVVTEIQTGRQKLSLSFREVERQTERKEFEKYIHDGDEDVSTSVRLGDFLKKDND